MAPALAPSVQTVPDLDAPQAPQPSSPAPQLLDPCDKTARADSRWAVVPAQWPKKEVSSRQLSDHPVTPIKLYQPQTSRDNAASAYDDRGWKSAAGF